MKRHTLFERLNRLPTWAIVGAILVVASFLRLYRLDSIPPSPYWEETALGYDAYSIAKTGKDFHGNPYPILAFPSFGDYKPSGYFYAIVPFVQLLGLNIWAVRLPSALAGIISVGLMYLIGSALFEKRVGMIASALLAISPWALQFSRGGWEVNFALMLVLVGVWMALVARKRPWLLLISVMFFVASMYTYHAARLFAPLVGGLGGLLLLWSWFKGKGRSLQNLLPLVISGLLAVTLVMPLVLNLKSSTVSSRFDATSIFTDPGPVLESNKQIELHGNTKLAHIVYNRYWYYGAIALKAFVSHFSPDFLFVRGDGNLRHGIAVMGLLYPIDAFFLIVATGAMLLKRERKLILLLLCLACAGIAPALVTPAPHALRFLFALPTFTLFTAYGIVEFTRHCRFNQLTARKIGVGMIYLLCFLLYVRYYYRAYPIKAAADWQYGYQQLYQTVSTLKKPGEKVYITTEYGRPSMYYLFYTAYDPAKEQAAEPHVPKDQLELLQVDDYYFLKIVPSGVSGLVASSPHLVDANATILATIKSLDGATVWVIWRK